MVDRSKQQARPSSAALQRGAEPRDVMQAASDQAGLSLGKDLHAVTRAAAERTPEATSGRAQQASRSRRAAAARRSDAVAPQAPAQQPDPRASAATRGAAEALALKDGGLGNIAYVRALWAAFEAGGVAAMAALMPPHVRWRPLEADGRVLHGTDELAEFWGSRQPRMPTLRMFHGRGDDVLVEAVYGEDEHSRRAIWLQYHFQGDRLVEAIGFSDEAQARSYQPPPAPS